MPNKIGRFDVLSEITKSEMGSVYKATDPESGQTVAVKTLRLEVLSPEHRTVLVRQILQEAESSKILNSPNIALLYGASEMEGQLCAAMEYVQGNSIGTMLARKEGFSIWDLLDISRQACQGLDHAHSHQVTHYSLEPAKVMVTWDGTVKVLSFGVSMMGALASQASGVAPSVLYYMSPEQLHGDPLDARSNLFSLGAILYEMVTERKAFAGEDADAVRQKILEEMPPPPVQIQPKVHPALSEVIMKALSKAPEERYQSGQELVNDLEKCKESTTKATAKKAPVAPAASAPKAPAPPAAKVTPPTPSRVTASTPKPVAQPAMPAPKAPVASAPRTPVTPTPTRQESPRIAAANRMGANSNSPAPTYSAKKAAAAAAGLEGSGGSGATPKLDSSAQFINSCVKASVDAIGKDGPDMSAAVEEEEQAPSISVDPMMAEDGPGKGQGPSFSDIDELPPLKDIYVAPPSEPVAPPAAEMGAPVLVTPPEPPKPKVQPREVAKKAVKEIKKTPPKLFAYSIAGAVTIILVVIVAIAYHIRSQNEDEEDTAPATTAVAKPAPTPAPEVQAPTPAVAPETVAPEPVVQAQPEVTVKPRYSGKRKPTPPPAPVIVPGQLTVNSTPGGALVHVDGQSDAGWLTPYNLTGLSPGRHTVVVSKNGYTAETRAIDVTSGSKSFLVVQLAPSIATLSVTSDPAGASIYVDGHDTGHVTPADVHAEKGAHTILVRKQGYLDETANANVQIGQTFHFAPVLRALGTTDDIKTVGKFKKFFGGGDVAGMGMVSIKTQPKGAQVAVNRRIVEKATPVQFYLNPGNYEVDITSSGYKPIHRIINVEKGGKLSFDETMQRE